MNAECCFASRTVFGFIYHDNNSHLRNGEDLFFFHMGVGAERMVLIRIHNLVDPKTLWSLGRLL